MLQDIAAARHIVIMCGSMEIDGNSFCLGLKALEESEDLPYTLPGRHGLPSLTNLIKQANVRPKYTEVPLEGYSLHICSLVELITMFHTRKASDHRDKVFALISMSSEDDPLKTTLKPDYNISWDVVLHRMAKLVLGEDIAVEISSQRAVIRAQGGIVGQITSVNKHNRQLVTINTRN